MGGSGSKPSGKAEGETTPVTAGTTATVAIGSRTMSYEGGRWNWTTGVDPETFDKYVSNALATDNKRLDMEDKRLAIEDKWADAEKEKAQAEQKLAMAELNRSQYYPLVAVIIVGIGAVVATKRIAYAVCFAA